MAGYKNFQVYRNKAFRGINIFKKGRNFNQTKEKLSKSERLMNGIALWTSYYRLFPHVFVKDYLGINLKLFQIIILYCMMHDNYAMYIAARGQGKTWLTAIFCVVRCILYPGTKIVIASGRKSQAREVIEKIADMRNESPNLAREICDLSTNENNAGVEFHNGSWIKIVASNDGARSKRANVIVVDEFRMVALDVINKVLRKFLTAPRRPKYLDKPEYKHLKERNKEIYLSTAWFKQHWSWNKFNSYFNAMVEGKKYFVCGLPYQLSIAEDLLMEEQVRDEMSEDDFDAIGWSMEMEALFFGESEKAFFKFEDLQRNRTIELPLYPKSFYGLIKDNRLKYRDKKPGEIRILSCDIAGMIGKENDASAFALITAIPTKRGYERRLEYMESMVGGHTTTQAIRIKQLFYDFDCDYLVLDTQNLGLGVYDQLVQPLFDKERNIEYEAWDCMNDPNMQERCLIPDSPKIIYSVKGNAQFNSDCAVFLRDNFKRGKFKLLVDEREGRETLLNLKGFSKLPIEEQAKFEVPYRQTSALINEMVNLEYELKNDLIRLQEPKTARKDRYSSIAYGNYFINLLEKDLLKKEEKFDWASYAIWN